MKERNTAAWAYNRATDGKDEWLTPKRYIDILGPFDLDPCAPIVRPWPTAATHFTIADNGLRKPWQGRVWCNPPYDRYQINTWVKRAADHGNCLLLVFSRTETDFWTTIWNRAHAVLFHKGRIRFHHVNGRPGTHTGGAGSAFVAFDAANADLLDLKNQTGQIHGKFIRLR